jgi:abequosyltransferase
MSHLLTIGIPTYNRASFLERCLSSFISQLNGLEDKVELIVSDNASIDTTKEIVDSCGKFFPIRYIKNDINKGADFNIAQVFDLACGKYVWVCGDDDFVLPGALLEFLKIIDNNNVGAIYLNSISFSDESNLRLTPIEDVEYTVYHDAIQYYKKINYFATFITGNVINLYCLK